MSAMIGIGRVALVFKMILNIVLTIKTSTMFPFVQQSFIICFFHDDYDLYDLYDQKRKKIRFREKAYRILIRRDGLYCAFPIFYRV